MHWIERWQQGDPVAAEELFRRYATRLSHVAEQHLSRRVKTREDGEDVVQSVFRSFFRRCADGDFRIDSADQLWRLLVSITLFKARSRVRHHTADKRDVGSEAAEEEELRVAVSGEPGPDEAIILVDLFEALLRDLPVQYGQVLELRLQGWPHNDIAEQLSVSRQTVYRVLTLLRQRLDRALSEEA